MNSKMDMVGLFVGGEWRVVNLEYAEKRKSAEKLEKYRNGENVESLFCYVLDRMAKERVCSATNTIEYVQMLTGCISRPIKKDRIIKAL